MKMPNRTQVQISLFALLVGLDQATKWWIEQEGFQAFTVIDGLFDIVRAHNTGVAFSMFNNLPDVWRTSFLVLLTCTIAIAVTVWWSRERNRPGPTSWLLICILAGAVGNIWDRIQLGYVVDFILWHITINDQTYYWPAFNIADSCISVSVVLLLILNFRQPRKTAQSDGGS